MEKKKNKPGQGRKPLGKGRGGLVPLMISVFADQAERLKEEGNQSWLVRMALDELFDKIDSAEKKNDSGSAIQQAAP